jgi:hypothetical protein
MSGTIVALVPVPLGTEEMASQSSPIRQCISNHCMTASSTALKGARSELRFQAAVAKLGHDLKQGEGILEMIQRKEDTISSAFPCQRSASKYSAES